MCSSVIHASGLVTSIILTMMHGAGSHIMESGEPKLGMEPIGQFACAVAVSATNFLQVPMNEFDAECDDISSMRSWVAAAASFVGAIRRWRILFPRFAFLNVWSYL